MQVHHSNDDNPISLEAKKDAEWKRVDQTAPDITLDYRIYQWIHPYSRSPFFNRTDETLTQILLLAIIKVSSLSGLSLCSRMKN